MLFIYTWCAAPVAVEASHATWSVLLAMIMIQIQNHYDINATKNTEKYTIRAGTSARAV